MTYYGDRPDIDAAIEAMNDIGSGGAEVEVLDQHVGPDERVLCLASAVTGRVDGLLVLTDRRYLFLREARWRSTQVSVPLDLITAVQVHHGLLNARIRTQGAQSLAEFRQVDKVDAELFAGRLRDLINRRSRTPAAAPARDNTPAAAQPDPVVLLRQLKELVDIGALTAAEYESKKRDLLGRI